MSTNFKITKPSIIVLTGHSSATKSTIISDLQRHCDNPLIHISYDAFFLSIGPRYFGEKAKEGFEFESFYKENATTTEKLRTHIHYGPLAFTVMKGMINLALFYYNQGLNVILDDVIYYDEILKYYSEILGGTRTFIFNLFCEGNALLERERYRFNRPLGLGIHQQEIIMEKKHWNYDLTINTTNTKTEDNAAEIINIVNNKEPKAIIDNINL